METLEGKKAVVTGGSRGFGLGIVEALVARKARVTVVARDADSLGAVSKRLGVDVIRGDAADPATGVLRDVRPSVLVLNAGVQPPMGPIHELTWEDFSETWNTDVKVGFHWVQEAFRLPLPRGSRVLIGSSGAAVNGSPLSGGYAGAKRILWPMAHYASGMAKELDLDMRFQAIVPMQISGDTELGRKAAETYARKQGISLEPFLSRFGAPLSPQRVGEHVVAILTDPRYANGVAFALKGDTGITSLDG